MPYADFEQSAKVLDVKRLGKQRVETYQILKVLLHVKKHPQAKPAWYHHPAVLMWKGYEKLLCLYGIAMCTEWKLRGYEDSLEKKFVRLLGTISDQKQIPSWLETPKFHLAHRSNLLRKDPKHYRQYWPKLRSDMEYYWPVTVKTLQGET